MLHKIVIGTANFAKPYGILSANKDLSESEKNLIFKTADQNGIITYDTALAYGDCLKSLNKNSFLKKRKIITKFSVLDDCETITEKLTLAQQENDIDCYYGLLIHDPQNIKQTDTKQLSLFFENLKAKNLVQKIGVSLYDLKDLKEFRRIVEPELIQIPINPLNQQFINDEFIKYVTSQDIELHGRSLFLQGVLLSPELPESLEKLRPLWEIFVEAANNYSSRLKALLSWANMQKFISKWVLGVSSSDDFLEIITCSKGIKNDNETNYFLPLQNISHCLADPRNWSI